MLDLTGDDRVEPHDLVFPNCNVRLRGIGLLGLQRVTYEEAIKLWLAAGELLNCVRAVQFLDAKWLGHESFL